MTAAESKEIEDDRLETLLDAVDARTARQQLLHSTISNGFMSLARERYRDPSSIERTYNCACVIFISIDMI